MRTPNAYAVAVRKADGTIVNIAARLPKWSDKYPIAETTGAARQRGAGAVDGSRNQGSELFSQRSFWRCSGS